MVLTSIAIVVLAIDVLSTHIGLRKGFEEANPLIALLTRRFGINRGLGLYVLYVSIVLGVCYFLDAPSGSIIFILVTVFAIRNNMILLLKRRR
ncbi:DUF5658 family protein [Deinococcus sp.]|uniref:DUF5658 family protein n=1 Tax=Deinococcus sp. TaxID=47478 RepID=UPI0034502A1F